MADTYYPRPVTRADWQAAVFDSHPLVRYVVVDDVSTNPDLGPGVIVVTVRGPLRLPLPKRIVLGIRREAEDWRPATCVLTVRT